MSVNVGNANLYIQKYLQPAGAKLQKETFLYEGVFKPLDAEDFDRGLIDFQEKADYHEDILSVDQEISAPTYDYERRVISKSPYGASPAYYPLKIANESKMISVVTDMASDVARSLARKKNGIVARGMFADGATMTNNNTVSAAAWPGLDAEYVVGASASDRVIHGAPAGTVGMHWDKVLYGFELIAAQGYDPNVHSESLFTVMTTADFNNLKASKDSSGNKLLSDNDFTMMPFDVRLEGDDIITKSYVRLCNKLNVIIDDSFFIDYKTGTAINRKASGLGGTTLTNGRRIPMFLGSSFRWFDRVIEPLEIRRIDNKYSQYHMVEAREGSLTRVQELGMVEIEVATAIS